MSNSSSVNDIELAEEGDVPLVRGDPEAPDAPRKRTESQVITKKIQDASSDRPGVERMTLFGGVLVVTRTVKKEYAEKHRLWLEKIAEALNTQKGFKRFETHPPIEGHHEFWTHVVEFETLYDSQQWAASEVRAELMDEVREYSLDEDIHFLRTDIANSFIWGFGANAIGTGKPSPPIPWKQVMVIMTLLYPTSLLINYLISHFYREVWPDIPIPIAIFFGAFPVVCLLAPLLIPLYMRHFGWWATQRFEDWRVDAAMVSAKVTIWAILALLTSYTWTPMV